MGILLNIIYLIATVTFIVGLKMLGHPETAKKGNLTAAVGMGLAIVGTIFVHEPAGSTLDLYPYWDGNSYWLHNWLVDRY